MSIRTDSFPSVAEVLPHKAPMILLDEIVQVGQDFVECLTQVDPAKIPSAEGEHVALVVGLEYMAQTVAAFGGLQSLKAHEPIGIGFLLGTRKLACFCEFFPAGQKILSHARYTFGDAEMGVFDCWLKDFSTRQVLMQGKLNVFRPKNLQEFLKKSGDVL